MSSYDTGIWSGASRIATFAGVIGWSIGSVLSVRVARYSDPKHLREYLSKAWKLALLVIFVLVLSIPLAGLSISLTIGPAYLSGTLPLQILLLATGISGATAPYIALFYLFDKPQYYAYAGLLQTAILIGGDLLFIPQFGLIGAATVRVVVRLSVTIFTLLYVRSSYREFLKQGRV
jgi:O-antigen/teichoic acid export membrane protein